MDNHLLTSVLYDDPRCQEVLESIFFIVILTDFYLNKSTGLFNNRYDNPQDASNKNIMQIIVFLQQHSEAVKFSLSVSMISSEVSVDRYLAFWEMSIWRGCNRKEMNKEERITWDTKEENWYFYSCLSKILLSKSGVICHFKISTDIWAQGENPRPSPWDPCLWVPGPLYHFSIRS